MWLDFILIPGSLWDKNFLSTYDIMSTSDFMFNIPNIIYNPEIRNIVQFFSHKWNPELTCVDRDIIDFNDWLRDAF